MFFGYLQAIGAREQAWLTKTFNMLDILSYPVSMIGPTMVGLGEKVFKIKVLRRLENVVLNLVFANRRAISLAF